MACGEDLIQMAQPAGEITGDVQKQCRSGKIV